MYEKIYELTPQILGSKHKYHQRYSARGQMWLVENGFQCRNCHAYIYTLSAFSGVQNRNHCPFCLTSRHVDHSKPGDRMSACKAIMQPIGLTLKRRRNKYGGETNGELMLIHRCSECGKVSINRIAADDQAESLMEIFRASSGLEPSTQQQLEVSGIHLLQGEDLKLVVSQLHGMTQQ